MSALISVCVACTVLVASAVAKLVSEHQSYMLLSREAYYLVSVAEIGMAIGLTSRFRRVAAWVLFVLALGGSSLMWVRGGFGRCGCFGSWELGTKYHLMLLAVVGLCAIRLIGSPGGAAMPVLRDGERS